jgi:hypothetical protein
MLLCDCACAVPSALVTARMHSRRPTARSPHPPPPRLRGRMLWQTALSPRVVCCMAVHAAGPGLHMYCCMLYAACCRSEVANIFPVGRCVWSPALAAAARATARPPRACSGRTCAGSFAVTCVVRRLSRERRMLHGAPGALLSWRAVSRTACLQRARVAARCTGRCLPQLPPAAHAVCLRNGRTYPPARGRRARRRRGRRACLVRSRPAPPGSGRSWHTPRRSRRAPRAPVAADAIAIVAPAACCNEVHGAAVAGGETSREAGSAGLVPVPAQQTWQRQAQS